MDNLLLETCTDLIFKIKSNDVYVYIIKVVQYVNVRVCVTEVLNKNIVLMCMYALFRLTVR